MATAKDTFTRLCDGFSKLFNVSGKLTFADMIKLVSGTDVVAWNLDGQNTAAKWFTSMPTSGLIIPGGFNLTDHTALYFSGDDVLIDVKESYIEIIFWGINHILMAIKPYWKGGVA